MITEGMKQGAISMHKYTRSSWIRTHLFNTNLERKSGKNMGFRLGHMSLYICDTCRLFQESELLMKTDLKLYILQLCPKKNWKSVLYSVFMAFGQFDSVNSWWLFLHAVIFSVNTDSFHIWKIKGSFSTILFHYVFSILFPQDCDLPKSETLLFAWCIILSYLYVPTSWVKY